VPEAAVLASPAPAGAASLRLPSVNVLSVGTDIPAGRVSNAQVAAQVGVTEEWIVSRTGISERPRARPEERLSDCAARAGAQALAQAGIAAIDVDLVIVATITPDEITPATAPLVARALGATRAGAFDVSAACTGFLTGLAIAAGQIESGRARIVLLIGADFLSRITDHDDKRSAPLFADGAGAVVVSAGAPRSAPAQSALAGGLPARGEGWVGPVVLNADGDPGQALYATHEQRQLKMDGPEVFRNAVARMHEASLLALAGVGLTLAEVDLFVYHQANARITRAVRERLGLSEDRVVDCIAHLGNSSAATVPLALAHAQGDGRLRPGTIVLLSAFGAGFTWGACVIGWAGSELPPPSSRSTGTPPDGASAPLTRRV
jgi:3-oxoacyl-[acyl-carrier-protein] synthase-3